MNKKSKSVLIRFGENNMQEEVVQIIKSFIEEFYRQSVNEGKVLYYNKSEYLLFEIPEIISQIDNQKFPTPLPNSNKYSLIIANLPFGMRSIEFPEGIILKRFNENHVDILNLTKILKSTGFMLAIVESNLLLTRSGKTLLKELEQNDYYINGYIRLPERALAPNSNYTPSIAIISKSRTQKLFVAEMLNSEQAKQIARNYFSYEASGTFPNGESIHRDKFLSFSYLRMKPKIQILIKQFEGFEKVFLMDVAIKIRKIGTDSKIEISNNSLFVPSIGFSKVVTSMNAFKLKPHNYFQVILREGVSNEYLALFFSTTLGQLILNSLHSESYIPHLTKGQLEKALLVKPQIEIQNQIVQTDKKLQKLRSEIDNLSTELATNPIGSTQTLKLIDKLAYVIGSLNDADRIRGKIREGESKVVEFKETLNLDVKKKIKEKYIVESALKTVIAFLNTEGGTLLIGVKDDGDITGVDNEIKIFFSNSKDKFMLHWKNLLKDRVGEGNYGYIDWALYPVNGKLILEVVCQRSKNPCFLDDKLFFVRTNPSTDRLEGAKQLEYIKTHFNSFTKQ